MYIEQYSSLTTRKNSFSYSILDIASHTDSHCTAKNHGILHIEIVHFENLYKIWLHGTFTSIFKEQPKKLKNTKCICDHFVSSELTRGTVWHENISRDQGSPSVILCSAVKLPKIALI